MALYIMNKTNLIQSAPVYTAKLNTYILREYEKFRDLSDQLKSLPLEDQEATTKSEKYLFFIEGLATTAILCRRMCSLAKICSKSMGSLVKVLKVCKEIESLAVEQLSVCNKELPNLW